MKAKQAFLLISGINLLRFKGPKQHPFLLSKKNNKPKELQLWHYLQSDSRQGKQKPQLHAITVSTQTKQRTTTPSSFPISKDRESPDRRSVRRGLIPVQLQDHSIRRLFPIIEHAKFLIRAPTELQKRLQVTDKNSERRERRMREPGPFGHLKIPAPSLSSPHPAHFSCLIQPGSYF